MPHRLTDHAQIEVADDRIADDLNCLEVAKALGRTSFRINQPLVPNSHKQGLPEETVINSQPDDVSGLAFLTMNGDRLLVSSKTRKSQPAVVMMSYSCVVGNSDGMGQPRARVAGTIGARRLRYW